MGQPQAIFFLKSLKSKMRDLSRTEINNLIEEWILNERDRRILKQRLLDGICYEPLAEEFGLSVQRVKSIVYKSQDKIFRHVAD